MPTLIGANYASTITSSSLGPSGKAFGLGDRSTDQDGKDWVFVQASGAIAQYDVVYLTSAYVAATLSTSNDARGNIVAVAPIAFADTEYGWVQVKGPTTMNVKASCAANVRINTTATAGSLDDDGTAGSMQVQGIYLTTARAASDGSAPGILNFPFVDATL